MASRRLLDAARASYDALSKVPGVESTKMGMAAFAARRGWTAWASLPTGDRLRVDLANSVGRTIWFRGGYDEGLVDFVLEPLGPGDAFLDVGANVGYYAALAASRVGSTGQVFAVEPHPGVAALLAGSIAHNGWDNVVLLTVAATRAPSLLRFHTVPNSGRSHITETGERVVAGVPLDAVVEPLLGDRTLRSIKLDVEGHELEALAGMARLFDTHPPQRILAEAHVSEGRDWLETLFGFFADRGYRPVDPSTSRDMTIDDLSQTAFNVGFVR